MLGGAVIFDLVSKAVYPHYWTEIDQAQGLIFACGIIMGNINNHFVHSITCTPPVSE